MVIESKQPYYHTIIAYCNSTTDKSQNKGLYEVTFFRKMLSIRGLLRAPSVSVTNCFVNSKYIAEYENGFVSAIFELLPIRVSLKFYKYEHKLNAKGQYEVECSQYNSVSLMGYLFITSRNQSGVETIYVIYPDKILILESYSPNYQTLNITN